MRATVAAAAAEQRSARRVIMVVSPLSCYFAIAMLRGSVARLNQVKPGVVHAQDCGSPGLRSHARGLRCGQYDDRRLQAGEGGRERPRTIDRRTPGGRIQLAKRDTGVGDGSVSQPGRIEVAA